MVQLFNNNSNNNNNKNAHNAEQAFLRDNTGGYPMKLDIQNHYIIVIKCGPSPSQQLAIFVVIIAFLLTFPGDLPVVVDMAWFDRHPGRYNFSLLAISTFGDSANYSYSFTVPGTNTQNFVVLSFLPNFAEFRAQLVSFTYPSILYLCPSLLLQFSVYPLHLITSQGFIQQLTLIWVGGRV